ncbi:hypothetical protein Tco_1181183 [Tanacetum coccineum]
MYHKKNLDFVTLIWEDLAYQIDNKDYKKQDKMFYPRFTKIIIHHFLEKDKSISMRNRTFMHTARDDSLLRNMRFVSRHEDTQIYGAIFLKAMTKQAMLDSVAYKTYYAIASGAKPSKSKKPITKTDSAISSEETPTKKKPTKAKKDAPSKKNPAATPKLTKKKALIKADRGKGLNVLSEVALSKDARLKEAIKQIKKDFHISQSSGSGDGTDFQSRVPIEEQHKIFGTDKGADDDDEDDTNDDEGNDDGDDSDGNDDNDDNDGDNDDDNDEHEDEEEENVDDITGKEDDEENEEDSDDDQHNVLQESGFEQEEEYAHVTLTTVHDTQKTEGPMQSSSVSSDFIEKLLNFENVSPADNEIASLMDTTVHTEEPSGQTYTLFTVPITVIPTTIPPPPYFFNPLPQQTTPTPTPTTSEVTTAFPSLLDFASVFRFNDNRYMDNKLGEAIHKAIQSHNAECREESQAKKLEYIDLVISSVRTIIREEVNTQLPQILPKAVSDFATPVIERNVTESLEVVVLARSSSQPKSTYEAAASLSKYELTKILLDRIEKSKSHLRAEYKRELYDALVKSYNTDKDLFNTCGEVFTLKRSRDDKDKDQDPSARSDRGTKRRKSSKEAESQKDPRSKEGKSSSSSKDTSRSHHKSSGKSAHTEEPSHTVDDSGVQKNQQFDTGNNDEQPEDEAAPKNDCVTARVEKPPTSFDELTDTPIDFSAFVMNRLNITNLTQELLVRPTFNLLKGTCKSLTELEYHFEECSKATTERLNWHNPEGKPYPFDLPKPLPLILDHRDKYSTFVTKTKAATYEIKWIEDMVLNLWSPVKVVHDKHVYWGTSHWGVKCQRFYGFTSNRESTKDVYSRKRIIAVTKLKIMKRYDYDHLNEIEVRREDQQLYTFKEGDFPRLRLQDIEDMLLLRVQQKLTNLTIDEHFDLNAALRMFTRRIVIQKRVEDLQLSVKSYQKKLNLTKPDTFRLNLRNRTAYTAYSDPQGVIYKDQNNKNRLMRTDELHKFNDGTLNDVRTALHDIASGIRMEYLPKRKWSGLDKQRARVMIQEIKKQLFQRRLMRNLEKFIGGREYGNDLRLLERTI